MNNEPFLQFIKVTKRFPGVTALNNASISFYNGELHALVGENGAGKSTMIKIISGVYGPDEGEIYLNGEKVHFKNPKESISHGISTVYQELELADDITVAENIYMGRLPYKKGGILDKKKLMKDTRDLLDKLHIEVKADTLIHELTIGYRQLVEIARVFSLNTKLVIFDEPTAVLTASESEKLFASIEILKKNGVAVIYISHRMEEVRKLADTITVLRDGKITGQFSREEATYAKVVNKMVGRDIDLKSKKSSQTIRDDIILEVEGVCDESYVKDVSFTLRKGEVLGFYGLIGAGRTELMRAIFGLSHMTNGKVRFEGEAVKIKSPQNAIKLGMAFVPEDRRNQGLVMTMGVRGNINLANHSYISRQGLINRKKEKLVVKKGRELFNIKTPSDETKVSTLSGGNQQKVVISRWMVKVPRAKMIIFDEPTRGIDVLAKAEVYQMIHKLAADGLGIIMVSSDMAEVLTTCDRIIVMRQGVISGILDAREATEGDVIQLTTQ